jgi:hypothetical protein
MQPLGKFVLDSSAAALSWLGRQGTRAVAALIVIGIAVPPIGAMVKPFVTEAVFVLLCIAFLRVEATAFRSYLSRPAIVLAATAWTSLVIPALFGASDKRVLGSGKPYPSFWPSALPQAIAKMNPTRKFSTPHAVADRVRLVNRTALRCFIWF